MDATSAPGLLGAAIDLLFGHVGRIGRLRYWFGLMAVAAITGFLAGIAESATAGTGDIGRLVAFAIIVGNLVWTHSALTVKRLHDRDRSGAWYLLYGLAPPGCFLTAVFLHARAELAAALLYMLAGIGFVWTFVELGFMRGTVGDNRFGPDPT